MLRCLIDIAAGMEYLHSLGVIHGDLKGANCLLKSTACDPRGFTVMARPCTAPRARSSLLMCACWDTLPHCLLLACAESGLWATCDAAHSRRPDQ